VLLLYRAAQVIQQRLIWLHQVGRDLERIGCRVQAREEPLPPDDKEGRGDVIAVLVLFIEVRLGSLQKSITRYLCSQLSSK